MYYRVDFKLCMLWTLLVLQVLLVIYYLLVAPSSYMFDYPTSTPKQHEFPFSSSSKPYPIKFVSPSGVNDVPYHKKWQGHLTEASRAILPNTVASRYFVRLINETVCFEQGTDIGYTKRRHVSTVGYFHLRNVLKGLVALSTFPLRLYWIGWF
jgi:hypothetical protein